MHVLYFHQYFATLQGSTGTRSYEFAMKLLARGHRVTMVCVQHDHGNLELPGKPGDPIRRGTVDGIEIIQFNIKYSNHFGFIRRTGSFLGYALMSVWISLREDYDLVFATSTPLTAGIPGIFSRCLRRKPFVFEVRDLWPELPRSMGIVKNPIVLAALSFLEWMTYRFASACVALSPGIGEGIARRSPKNRAIRIIPNGCDLSLFLPQPREELQLSRIGPQECVAVFTGAHGMANGLEVVLDAARVLKRRGRRDIVLAFIGDGKLKPFLVKRVQEEELENCRFYDPMPKERLRHIVSCADIGLMILANVPAFYYGTSPNKFFDYISSGLPVLNNYPGWLADLIQQYQCGVVVPPDDPELFADALCHLADRADLRRTYGDNARKLAETQFSRDRLANQFVYWLEDVYKGVQTPGINY